MIFRKPSAIKPLYLFTGGSDVKNITAVLQIGAVKSKHNAIRAGILLWSSIKNNKVHKKSINMFKNLFIIVFYNILRLFSLQSPIIYLEYILIVTLI